MSEVIRINSGIKKYQVLNERDEMVAELKINERDSHLLDKFINLIEKTNKIGEEFSKVVEDYNSKQPTIKDAKKAIKESEMAIKKVMAETEELFGEGLFKQIYAEAYELNEDFVPSIDLITEFYEQVLPLIQTIVSKRKDKYSPSKKGN